MATAASEKTNPARHVIMVASGKGGVGKSTVSLNLAVALAESGTRVGLLDADAYGPDIPRMVNLKRDRPLRSWTLASRDREVRYEPIERYGVQIMSVGFLIAEAQAMSLPAELFNLVVRQLASQVAWEDLDYLVVDVPPGTADLQQGLLELLPISGVLVVVTPQDVAHLDARKLLNLLKHRNIPIIGGVENMTQFPCPHCARMIDAFPLVDPGRSIWDQGVPQLTALPLDPALAGHGDTGRPIIVADSDSDSAARIRKLADGVRDWLEEHPR